MKKNKMKWAYETLACHLSEGHRMPGVENAFASGTYCIERYGEALSAYERLCDRLGVVDEDRDVETIFNAFFDIQEYLCCKMYQYGAQFGE